MSYISERYASLNKLAVLYKNDPHSEDIFWNLYNQIYLFLNDENILSSFCYSLTYKNRNRFIEVALMELFVTRFLPEQIKVYLDKYDPEKSKIKFTGYFWVIVKNILVNHYKEKKVSYVYEEINTIEFIKGINQLDEPYDENASKTNFSMFLLLSAIHTLLHKTSHLPHQKIIFLVCNRFYVKEDNPAQGMNEGETLNETLTTAKKKPITVDEAKKSASINQKEFLRQNLELSLLSLWTRFHQSIFTVIEKQNNLIEELKNRPGGLSDKNGNEPLTTLISLEQEYEYNMNEYHHLTGFSEILENRFDLVYTHQEYDEMRALFDEKSIGKMLVISFFLKELRLIRQQISIWKSRSSIENIKDRNY